MGASKLTPLLLLAAMAQLSGCMAAANAYDNNRRAQVEQQMAPFIGHEYWPLAGDIHLSAKPAPCNDLVENCKGGPIGSGKFTVESAAGIDQYQRVWLYLVFANGTSGYYLGSDADFQGIAADHPPPPPPPLTYPTFLDHLPPKEAARRHQLPGVELGMTEAQVLASAWGKPDRIKEIKKESSDRTAWYYPNENALFFNYGNLYAIQK